MTTAAERAEELARMEAAGTLSPGDRGKLEAWRRFGRPEPSQVLRIHRLLAANPRQPRQQSAPAATEAGTTRWTT